MNTIQLYTKCSFLTTKRESFSKFSRQWREGAGGVAGRGRQHRTGAQAGRAAVRKKNGGKSRIMSILEQIAGHNFKKIGPLQKQSTSNDCLPYEKRQKYLFLLIYQLSNETSSECLLTIAAIFLSHSLRKGTTQQLSDVINLKAG